MWFNSYHSLHTFDRLIKSNNTDTQPSFYLQTIKGVKKMKYKIIKNYKHLGEDIYQLESETIKIL